VKPCAKQVATMTFPEGETELQKEEEEKMSQSLTKIYLHIIFGTKNREKVIDQSTKPELIKYMAGILKKIDCAPIKIGGTSNHMHLLTTLPRTNTLSDIIKTTKIESSKWIKTKGRHYQNFHWQKGYGAFSVSQSHVDKVENYILNQEEHHKKKTFKEEYLEFLNKYKIEYDEKYVWE